MAAAASLGVFLDAVVRRFDLPYLPPVPLDLVAINVSLIGHFTPFVSGSMFLSDVGYYVSLALLALFLTTPSARRSMNGVIFVGVLAALVLLFAAGLRIPPGRGAAAAG